MIQLVEFPLESGGAILVEAESLQRGPVTRGAADGVKRAGDTLEHVLGQVAPALDGVIAQLRQMPQWPDEVEVELAIKLTTDARIVVARAGAEANFRLALRWNRAPR